MYFTYLTVTNEKCTLAATKQFCNGGAQILSPIVSKSKTLNMTYIYIRSDDASYIPVSMGKVVH